MIHTLTFEDWQFPHGEVPETWRVFPGSERCLSDLILPSKVGLSVIRRDTRCQITRWENVCEVAHLVPKHMTIGYVTLLALVTVY